MPTNEWSFLSVSWIFLRRANHPCTRNADQEYHPVMHITKKQFTSSYPLKISKIYQKKCKSQNERESKIRSWTIGDYWLPWTNHVFYSLIVWGTPPDNKSRSAKQCPDRSHHHIHPVSDRSICAFFMRYHLRTIPNGHVAMCIVRYDFHWGSLAIAKLHFQKKCQICQLKNSKVVQKCWKPGHRVR